MKLTGFGLDLDFDLCRANLAAVVEDAGARGNFVRIDMEGSVFTEATIAMTERLYALHNGRVGTVLQAYLFRTGNDAERLLGQGLAGGWRARP